MTHSPPHTLNFHNWLFTMKLQGTLETREESKKNLQLVTPRESASHDSSLIHSTNHEQLMAHGETSAEMRMRSGVLQGDSLGTEVFHSFPCKWCPWCHQTNPQLHWGHLHFSSMLPTQTNYPGSLAQVTWWPSPLVLSREHWGQLWHHKQLYRFPRLFLTPIRIRRNQCSNQGKVR